MYEQIRFVPSSVLHVSPPFASLLVHAADCWIAISGFSPEVSPIFGISKIYEHCKAFASFGIASTSRVICVSLPSKGSVAIALCSSASNVLINSGSPSVWSSVNVLINSWSRLACSSGNVLINSGSPLACSSGNVLINSGSPLACSSGNVLINSGSPLACSSVKALINLRSPLVWTSVNEKFLNH